jgi:hypothetical protein
MNKQTQKTSVAKVPQTSVAKSGDKKRNPSAQSIEAPPTASASPKPTKPTVSKGFKTVTAAPQEKVLARIAEMDGDKAAMWLEKTRRTMANHFDQAAKKRKCTIAYWNGLISRYDALTTQAKAKGSWSSYCTKISKSENHTAEESHITI